MRSDERGRASLSPSYVAVLFVPGDRPERFARAFASGADRVILDLEDAVANDAKERARDAVEHALAAGASSAWVRANAPSSSAHELDLRMLAAHAPGAVVIPKVAHAGDVDRVRAIVGHVPVVALIESLDGLANVDDIAARASGLAFGAFDLCAELGARPVPEVIAPFRSRVVVAARAAGIPAIDTPFIQLDDETGLDEDARRAVDFGFDGKLAIHPKQIASIHTAFVPDAATVARATAIVAASRRGGVVVVAGTMIDAPLVRAAERVLQRATRSSA